MKNYTNWAIVGAVVVVVLLGGWWLFMSKPAKTDTSVDISKTPRGATTTPVGGWDHPTTTPSGESLTVIDQPAGKTVAISSMKLSRESWVVVRDARSILGASRFNADATNGTVKLIRPTEARNGYQALIYVDDGDKKFDFKKDMLVTEVNALFDAQ